MKWTEPMRELLRDSYRARGAAWCAAMLGGVSAQAVRQQSLRLGLSCRAEPAAFLRWTAKEDDLLWAEYLEHGAVWCAAQLGRSERAVMQRAWRIGISKRGAARKTSSGKPPNARTRRERKAVARGVASRPQNALDAQTDAFSGLQDGCAGCDRRRLCAVAEPARCKYRKAKKHEGNENGKS